MGDGQMTKANLKKMMKYLTKGWVRASKPPVKTHPRNGSSVHSKCGWLLLTSQGWALSDVENTEIIYHVPDPFLTHAARVHSYKGTRLGRLIFVAKQ